MKYLIKNITLLVAIVTATNLLKADPTDSNQSGKIDCFHMMIVGKYFKIIDDFVNIEMVNKKYKEIILRYKYNPIPLTNERIRKLFSNIETQHLYDKNDFVFQDGLIKHYVHWYAVSYGETNNTNEVDTYKSVIFTQEDRKKTIGDDSTNAIIPPNVTEIEGDCFADCNKLISISIPSSVSFIGSGCFTACIKLTSISIPANVSVLYSDCFADCDKLISISIPPNVCILGGGCFANCDLTSISIPPNVSLLGDECFAGCDNLTNISIPTSVTFIGNECFAYCASLTSISIPSSVTFIGDECFNGCDNLTSISIPPSVTFIGDQCFAGCTSLRSITIPKKLWNKKHLGLSNDIQVHFHKENKPVQVDIVHPENQAELDDILEDADTFSYDEDF